MYRLCIEHKGRLLKMSTTTLCKTITWFNLILMKIYCFLCYINFFFLKRCNHFCRFFCDSLFNFYFTVAFGSLCSSDADCQHHYHAPPDGEVYCHNIYSHIGRCQIRTSKYKSNIFLLNKFDIFLSNLIESQLMKKEKNQP